MRICGEVEVIRLYIDFKLNIPDLFIFFKLWCYMCIIQNWLAYEVILPFWKFGLVIARIGWQSNWAMVSSIKFYPFFHLIDRDLQIIQLENK